jgi:hypothetical protein
MQAASVGGRIIRLDGRARGVQIPSRAQATDRPGMIATRPGEGTPGRVLLPRPCQNFNFEVSQFALDCSRFRLHAWGDHDPQSHRHRYDGRRSLGNARTCICSV